MDDLLAEIERKRKSIESNELTSNKKYFKRGDIINEQKDKVMREKLEKESQKAKEQLHVKQAESSAHHQQKSTNKAGETSTSDIILPREQVILLLRAKNQPIRLFGESDADAYNRLRLTQIMELDDNKELTNEFQDTLEKIDKAVLTEHYNVDISKKAREFIVLDSEKTIESIKENAKALGKSDDNSKDCEVLLSFFQLILSIWARDLNRRPLDEKLSLQGKIDSARYEQTYQYVKPLLKKLKNKSLTGDILKYMTLIIHYCLEREYIKANDAYLQMAIGNAPWPIGVTMVGIHVRSGRERISSQHVAHVLNDETQRKYIQGVKRLMSYCQRTYPTDPSRSVEFGTSQGKFL